ncbi:MAG: ATP-binding protein [Lentisphaerae bacterium]|nr:ATP-binding protein [Lentisphaerota bacterium]
MLKQVVKFANRKQELAFLSRAFRSSDAELLILYGRRRVGKTALLRHFAEAAPVPVFYHVAVQTTALQELSRFSAGLADFFGDPVLKLQPLGSWEALWRYLAQRAGQQAFGLMLDEFPYAVEGEPALPSVLQAVWDQSLRYTALKLVLCGSSMGMMERIGLLPSGPLYGRRTGQWKVLPLTPDMLGELWPVRKAAELLEAYCVVGGSPLYITRFDRRQSLFDNLHRHILTPGAVLYDEPLFLLREEIRDPRVYQSILSAIAGGARKFSELSGKTGLDKAHLTRYAAILADLGLVHREIPVTEPHPEKSRKGLYRISDPFLSFWYRFVFFNRDRLEAGRSREVLNDTIKPQFDLYVSRVVEPAIGTLFRSVWKSVVSFEPAFEGRHWSENEEFDWVLLNRDRTEGTVVEVKWTRSPFAGDAVMASLLKRGEQCRVLQGCKLGGVVVSRSGFSDRPESGKGRRFIDLQEPLN